MKNLFSNFNRLLLLGLAVMTMSVNVWGGTTYTITFKTNTSDGSTEIGTSTKVSTVISAGTDYVSGFTSSCSKAYYACKSGVKLGTSSATGTLEFNIASSYQSNIKKITIKSAKYSSDTGTLTLYSGSTSLKTGITPGTDYTHTFTTATTVSSIKITTSAKRAYVSEIILETGAADEPTITTTGTLSAFSAVYGSASAAQSFSVSGTNLTANIVATAPTGYEVSLSESSGYGASVSLTPSSKTVSSTNIYVRLKNDNNAGTISAANVALSSTGATTKNVSIPASKVQSKVNWLAKGETASGTPTTAVDYGTKVSTLPTAPTCDSKSFAGWTNTTIDSPTDTKPSVLFTAASGAPNIEANEVTYYAVFATSSGSSSQTLSYGWEEAMSSSDWEKSNLSDGASYNAYKKTGSYAASTGSSTTASIKTKNKIASPTSALCYYTKATSNTNTTSKFIIQVSTDGSAWTDVATGKTMNNVTQGTFEELSADLSSYSNVYVRFYYTGTNAIRVLDDVSVTFGGATYSAYTTSCGSTTSNFTNGETIFFRSQGSDNQSAWWYGACVKAWFHNTSSEATSTTWLNDGNGYKMFCAMVPATGDFSELQVQRFSNDCNTWLGAAGDLTQSGRNGKNTIASWRTTDPETFHAAWHDNVYTLKVRGSISGDSWATDVIDLSDAGAGVFTGSINHKATANTSEQFRVRDSEGVYFGTDGASHDNTTLSGMTIGSTYTIYASFALSTKVLSMTKTITAATVSFDMQGHGDQIAAIADVPVNTTISAPTSPTATGWDFGGWYKESACTNAWDFTTDKVTESMTLYAKWTEATKYTVTYYGNGNTDGSVPTDATQYLYGATVTVKTNTGSLTKTGYDFGGWNTKEDGTGTNYTAGTGTFTITANTPLYAKWNLKSYTVTKGTVTGGTATIPSSVNHGGDVTVTDLTPDATHKLPATVSVPSGTYGSIDGATIKNVTSNITVNVTFTAKTQYTVTLLNNNNPVNKEGFDAQGQKTYYEGQTLGTLPTLTSADACDNTSKTFMGWAAEKISTKRENAPSYVDSSTEVTQTITYYAVWAKEQ